MTVVAPFQEHHYATSWGDVSPPGMQNRELRADYWFVCRGPLNLAAKRLELSGKGFM